MRSCSIFTQPVFRFLVLLLLSLLLGCEPAEESRQSVSQQAQASLAPPEQGVPGGARLINLPSLPVSFNPYLSSEQPSLVIGPHLFAGLVRINAATAQMEPALAESITPDASQKLWTIRLRPGLKWSDGQPLSAQDVAFTYNQLMDNPKIPNNYRDFWGPDFPKVEALDPLTLKFSLRKPFAPFLQTLVAPILPRHVFANSLQPDAQGKLPIYQLWNINAKASQIVGSGPWKLAEIQPGSRLRLQANPYYYERDAAGQSLPYLKELILSEAPDADVSLIRFRRKETDVYFLRPEDYELLAPLAKQENFTIYNLGATPSQQFVMLNQSTARRANGKPVIDPLKAGWFRNPAFRQALAESIDKHAMIQSVYQGRAQVQVGHLSSYNPFFDPQLKDIQYNPQHAHELLFNAGFRQNAQGELFDKAGHAIRFELTSNTGNSQRDAISAILAREWGKLGMRIDYRPRPLNLLSRQIHESYDWEAMILGLAGSPLEPHFSASRWQQNGRMHLFNMGSGPNWHGKPTSHEPWEAEMEALYNQAAVAAPAKRKQLYIQAQQLERQQLPFIYLVGELNLVAVRNTLGNARPSVYGGSGLLQLNWNSQYHYLKD